jgi:thiol-disulfide isomerase/thioredoxin
MERVVYHATWCPFCLAFMEHYRELEPEGKEKILNNMSDPLWLEKNIDLVPTVIEYEDGKEVRRISARSGVGITREMYETWMKG